MLDRARLRRRRTAVAIATSALLSWRGTSSIEGFITLSASVVPLPAISFGMTHCMTYGYDMLHPVPFLPRDVIQPCVEESVALVRAAFEASSGKLGIDSADNYDAHDALRIVLREQPRDSYFLATKIASKQPVIGGFLYGYPGDRGETTHDAHNKTAEAVDCELANLGLAYVDMLLLHEPPVMAVGREDEVCCVLREQWRALEGAYFAGKAKAIGVSNYCPPLLECLLATARVRPHVNQLNVHVGSSLEALQAWGPAYGVPLQAYSALGSVDGSNTAMLEAGGPAARIGEAHGGKSAAQVALRWLVQHGIPLVFVSTSRAHIAQSYGALDDSFELTAGEMSALDAWRPSPAPQNVVELDWDRPNAFAIYASRNVCRGA